VPQQLALGIGRQATGLADTHRDIARRQQVGNPPVIDMLHNEHHVGRFLAQRSKQWRQQAELDIVGQPDAERHRAAGRVKIMGQAQGYGQRIQRWRQVPDDLLGPCRRLHAMAYAYEQRIIEHRTQAVECRTDGRLTEKQLLRHPSDIALEHQRFEYHHQVDIRLAKFIAIHPLPPIPKSADSLGSWCDCRLSNSGSTA